MSEFKTTTTKEGRIFYLMGASGVGKDSLLHYLRDHLPPDAPVDLVRRYITRPADAGGEEHIPLTDETFQKRLEADGFAMHWRSHGFRYGIGHEIDHALARGRQLVLNGSRHYLAQARQDYPTLCAVLISVAHDTLLERLTRRGREDREQIERRLERALELDRQLSHQSLIRLANDGPLCEAGERLLRLILQGDKTLSDRPRRAATN